MPLEWPLNFAFKEGLRPVIFKTRFCASTLSGSLGHVPTIRHFAGGFWSMCAMLPTLGLGAKNGAKNQNLNK